MKKKRIMNGYSVGPTIKSLVENSYISNTNTFILNLDHRFDRWKTMTQQLYGFPYKRESAIYGKLLNQQYIDSLDFLNNNNYPWRNSYKGHEKINRGEIGCILSHINIWNKCSMHEINLVFEDDIIIDDKFNHNWITLKSHLQKHKNWDIVFLGFTDDKNNYNDEILYSFINFNIHRFSDEPRKHGGGTFAYAISNRGANKLLSLVHKFGVPQAIDWFIIEMFPYIDAYFCRPHLVKCNINDSDIR